MICTTPARTLTLPGKPESVGEARKLLTTAYCGEHDARVHDDAALLVSELVANAVCHGLPPIEVEVRCDGTGSLEVRVTDHEPRPPAAAHPADSEAESGRGIALVDLLSDAWGVDQIPDDGKVVWFRLNAGRPAA
jgi:anti-sigma regulatory factor (Ser/Thr protein kinase)